MPPTHICSTGERMASSSHFAIVVFFGALLAVCQPSLAQTTETACAQLNTSCDACIANTQCFWCIEKSECMHYTWSFQGCSFSQARYNNCWVNYEALAIAGGVIGGCLLIGVIVGVCCCWCRCRRWSRARTQRQYEREQNELERRHEDTVQRNEQRRMERQANLDQIRQKYGLPNSGPAFEPIDNGSQAETTSAQ
uniref:Uncharacterized protein n=1 Tax=Plectus sambesii TaxID=2011161 RepID=A0A914XN02_9BILA